MGFKVSDDDDDDDIVLMNGISETEVSPESYMVFVNGDNEKPLEEVVLNLDPEAGIKERQAEINAFILARIVNARKNGHTTAWVLKHAAKALDHLAKVGGTPPLKNSISNAIGLYKKAKQYYVLQKLKEHVTGLNETVGSAVKAEILDEEKPRFTSQLFHAIADEIVKPEPKFDFTYKAGRKEEQFRYDTVFSMDAINHLKNRRKKIRQTAAAAKRELTAEETTQVDECTELISECWVEFFSGAKTIYSNASDMFPEAVGTGRTTTSAVIKGVCTMNSISFGAFDV